MYIRLISCAFKEKTIKIIKIKFIIISFLLFIGLIETYA